MTSYKTLFSESQDLVAELHQEIKDLKQRWLSPKACHFCEGANWTEEDVGEEVEIEIEGVRVWDTIVEMYLPNGSQIIGPSITCGHIFARFTMIPAMLEASEATKKHLEDSQ